MDLVYNRLPNDRARAYLDIFTSLFFFVFCLVLLYVSIPYVWHSTLVDRRIHSWVWEAKEWPTLWCIPVAAFLLLVQMMITLARNVRIAFKKRQQNG